MLSIQTIYQWSTYVPDGLVQQFPFDHVCLFDMKHIVLVEEFRLRH